MAGTGPYYSQSRPPSGTTAFTGMSFLVKRMISRMNVATPCQVQAITSKATIDQPGTMDVLPLVQMIDGANNVSVHGTVYGIAYGRQQAGSKAFIMDPKPGDIGIVVFADRDTTNVRSVHKAAPPASRRRNAMPDGVWVGTLWSPGQITSYAQFTDQGAIVLSDGTDDAEKPMQVIVAKDYAQMQKKGEPTFHITVDWKNGQLVAGMDFTIADNPYPDPPP